MRPTLGPVGRLNLYEANPVTTGSTLWARAGLLNTKNRERNLNRKELGKYNLIHWLNCDLISCRVM